MRSPVTVLRVVQQAPGGCRSFRLATGCVFAPAACVPVTLPRCCLAMPPPYTARLPTHSAGLVVASDQTDTLTRGYWPSFNVRSCAGTRLLPLRCSTERCAWHCARARPCLSTRAAGWHLGCMLLSSQPQPSPMEAPLFPGSASAMQIPYHREVYNASGYPAFIAQQAQRGPLYAAAAGA